MPKVAVVCYILYKIFSTRLFPTPTPDEINRDLETGVSSLLCYEKFDAFTAFQLTALDPPPPHSILLDSEWQNHLLLGFSSPDCTNYGIFMVLFCIGGPCRNCTKFESARV